MNDTSMPSMPAATESLAAPVHQEEVEVKTPELETVEKKISNSLTLSVPKDGIKVVATRKGFYNQQRIREGDKFVVKSLDHLGTWMTCEDPAFEEKRVAKLAKKKAGK